ncbi:MAG: thermonuclease family protein [Solirubrobacterales bacterium]|jgi:micrococcal nuclease|nr:thermonuclease family protein [Solirubrobacterales bacterium]
MKGRGSLLLLFVVAVILLRPWEFGQHHSGTEPSQVLTGVAVRAVDGDTLEVRLDDGDVETVRLIGVDTPETVKPDTPVQCFGPQASAFEHRHTEGKRVRLLVGVEPRDFYGRLLAYVFVDNRFLEVELLRRGLARTLTFHPNDRFAPRFEKLERIAAKRGKGLWNAC